eukprot:1208478-Rhodomonas_salina.1
MATGSLALLLSAKMMLGTAGRVGNVLLRCSCQQLEEGVRLASPGNRMLEERRGGGGGGGWMEELERLEGERDELRELLRGQKEGEEER